MRLQNKKALVTGGSEGIGRAIAECFLREGASVLVTARNGQKLENAVRDIGKALPESAGKLVPFPADATDAAQAQAAVQEASRKWGGLDILVNNAGGGVNKPISESSVEDFDRDMGWNVRSAVAHTHAVLGSMKKTGKGCIINISSVAASLPVPVFSFYSIAKAALLMYTQTLASEVAQYGIRINCVSPGPVNTPFFDKTLGAGAEAAKQLITTRIPLGRLGTSDEVAHAVAFLASDEAGWITGINLLVDGGRTIFSNISSALSPSPPPAN
jgi:NAD(P)-dependent dehydrogenase (short-subunit alcohol dehydrogenase family)